MVELPPELIELIIDFLPYESNLWGKPAEEDKKSLLACMTAFRSFHHAARRRLFSTFVIRKFAQSSHNLQSLYELVQRPDFLVLVRTLKIQVVEGKFWPLGSNDPHVQRVLSAFNQPHSDVQHLCLECPSDTSFNHTFGQLAQRELLALLPRIHSLSIRGMASPIAFLENATLLKNLQLLDAPLEIKDFPLGLPLPQHLEVAVFGGSEQVKRLCLGYQKRYQEPPSFGTVRFETSTSYRGPKLTELLQRSMNTLHLLEIKSNFGRRSAPSVVEFDIGGLENLKTLRFIFDISVRDLLSYSILHSLVGVSQASVSPSYVINIEVLILCHGSMDRPTDVEGVEGDAPRVCFHHLDPKNLVKHHPALQSLDFIYDFSQVQFSASESPTVENVQCLLQKTSRAFLARAILGSEDVEEHRQANISVLPYLSVRASWISPSPWIETRSYDSNVPCN